MKLNRIGRLLVCLLLVCALVINISPIKAEATSAGLVATFASAGAVTVSAPVAIAAGLIALGIMVGTNDDFQRVVDNAVSSLGDWIKDGTVELLQTIDSAGKKAYYVASDLMEDIRAWSFESGTISKKALELGTGYFPSADKIATASAAPYAVLVYYNDGGTRYYHICYSYTSRIIARPYDSTTGKGVYIATEDGKPIYSSSAFSDTFKCYNNGLAVLGVNDIIVSVQRFGSSDPVEYSSSYDISIGVLPFVSTDFTDGSSARQWSEEYTDRGLYVDPVSGGDGNDEDAKWYWPVVLGPEVESLTQTDQWTGETPEEFDDYEIKEEYEIVGAPAVDFGYGVEIKPVTVPGTGDNTDVDSGVIDGSVDYTSLLDKIVGYVQSLWNAILELPGKFADWFDSILDAIEALPDKFATWFDSIVAGIEAIPGAFADWFADIISGLTSIWEAICSIPAAITDALTAIFVPSEDFLTVKVEALRARFNWIEPILGYGEFIKAQFIDPVPPVVYVHLGDAEGSYNYGGTVKFLDMSWYERYKPYGDTIISGFLWALFAWRMYLKLPGIINGAAGDVGQITYGESAWQKAAERKARKGKKE